MQDRDRVESPESMTRPQVDLPLQPTITFAQNWCVVQGLYKLYIIIYLYMYEYTDSIQYTGLYTV